VASSGECYGVTVGVVCLQVKLCDPYLSALEVRFSRRDAIQIDVYLNYLYLTFIIAMEYVPLFDIIFQPGGLSRESLDSHI